MTIGEASLKDFKAGLRGDMLFPGDHEYDTARRVFNAMIDKHPAMIVRCGGAGDVMRSVNFALAENVRITVRGGGHSVAGNSACDGGMLIDLSGMKGMRVDPARRTANAQPGLRLGEFDREAQAFGLATTLGIVSNTGIAGLTLGGGIGWLNGKYGLACDNLVSVDIIAADGRFLTASASENQDLFWALRGGSGNFGVVTSFTYCLHPVGPVLGGMLLYSLQDAKQVLRSYQDFALTCPDELSTIAAIITGPEGKPMVAIAVCHCGHLDEGNRFLNPLRSIATPVTDLIQSMPYVVLQEMLDETFPFGHQHYWKSGFSHGLSEEGIEIMIDFMLQKPSPLTFSYLQHLHGAAGRVPPSETAFAHRGDRYDFAILSMWPDAGANHQNVTWTREFFERMRPHLDDGVYVNNLGEEGDERVRAAYGLNYQRLKEVKRKYDPANFFWSNQNIEPAFPARSEV
jgi:FAD/FMN-containing dehydrogenase